MNYLPPHTNFNDIPLMEKPEHHPDYVPCTKCKGHGKFNYRLNAYGPKKHFQGSCGVCWGWGWIPEGQCEHEWQDFKTIGHCLHLWKCKKCHETREVDSSD